MKLCIQILAFPDEPPFQSHLPHSRLSVIAKALVHLLKRFRRLPPPRTFSAEAWHSELRQTGFEAALAAEREHDPAAGCPLFQFVYLRAHAGMLAYYRKEWAYATHSGAPSISVEDNCPGELTSPASAPDQIAAVGELREALQALPGEERQLLLSLFIDGRTESELAETLKVSQHTVSKRKRTAVANLRKLLFDSNQSRQMAQPTDRIPHAIS